jgi:hypothetical protein
MSTIRCERPSGVSVRVRQDGKDAEMGRRVGLACPTTTLGSTSSTRSSSLSEARPEAGTAPAALRWCFISDQACTRASICFSWWVQTIFFTASADQLWRTSLQTIFLSVLSPLLCVTGVSEIITRSKIYVVNARTRDLLTQIINWRISPCQSDYKIEVI